MMEYTAEILRLVFIAQFLGFVIGHIIYRVFLQKHIQRWLRRGRK